MVVQKYTDGSVIGNYNDNTFLNTMVYDVEFSDSTIREYAANIIAENMYAQVDPYGRSHSILDCILDFKKIVLHLARMICISTIKVDVVG